MQGRPRGEPADDRRLDRVPARGGQARDLRRRALLRRLARRPALRAARACAPRRRRAPRRSTLCDTNGSSLPSQVAAATAAAVAALGDAVRDRDPLPQRRRVRRREHARGRRGGRAPGPGHDERRRRAHRQRQPRLDHRQPAAQARPRCLRRRAARAAHRDRALRRRAAQPSRPTPTSPTSGATPSRTRAACTSPASRADATTFEHIDPALVGNERELLVSELAGRASVLEKAAELGHRARRRDAPRGARARQAARARGLPVRGRRRLARAAAAPRDRRLRAALHARVLARDRRAARRRRGADRGDDQDLGRRRAPRAHRRGQRPGQRARPRAARARSARSTRTSRDIELVNFKVRILDETKGTGAVTRVLLDASDGDAVWGSIGVAENLIAASWQALVDSLERGMLGRARRRSDAPARSEIPLAQPVLGAAEEERGHRGAALRPALARAAARRVRGSASPRASARRYASAVSSGTAGLHLALRAAGVARRRRGHHDPVLVRRLGERDRLRARPAGLRRHRPASR